MSQKAKVYFHLGLPKTGSTYLQAKIFPEIPKINYFKKHDYKKYKNLIPENNEIYFFTCEKDVILFDEMDRIKDKFPDNAYIILVFRKHYSWIVSKYKNHIRKYGHLKFNEFFSTQEKSLLNINQYFYSSLSAAFCKKFDNRVLFLNYDELKKSPHSFIRKIYNFLGINKEEITYKKSVVKRSFSTNQLIILRKFNDSYRYKKLRTKYRLINRIHYKYRHFLLHIVAFLSRFIPTDSSDFEEELNREKETINAYFKEDWDYMLTKFR